jgi:hypothetical protein
VVEASSPKMPAAECDDVLASLVEPARPVPPTLISVRAGPLPLLVSVAQAEVLLQVIFG